MFCDAVAGTSIASGFRFVGLKGGISGIFMNIFFPPDAFGVSIFGISVAWDLVASAFRALDDSRALAAFCSIAFCFSSSFASIGKISLGIGKGTSVSRQLCEIEGYDSP